MPNIYLRVPPYVAAFYRHRDEKNLLTEFQPVVFEEFSFEQVILKQGMVSDVNKKFLNVLCYSQASWKNILQGKLPKGGKAVITRDEKKWITAREITWLEGRQLKQNEELFDYLCIALPRDMVVGDHLEKVDRHITLDGQSAQRLANVLRNEFYCFFYDWGISLQRTYRAKGLEISKAECLERFYAQYDIPIVPGTHQQESMRMLAKRLFWRAEKAKNHRAQVGGEYYDY